MKRDALIICYSRTGTTDMVARQLAAMTGWPLSLLRDVQPRTGLWGDWRCAWEGLLAGEAPYDYHGPRPGRFQHAVLMAPIWMGHLASPMRCFIKNARTSQDPLDRLPRSVSAICVMGTRGGFRAVDEMSRILGQAPSPSLALEQQEVQQGRIADMLAGFVSGVRQVAKAETHDPVRPQWLSAKAV